MAFPSSYFFYRHADNIVILTSLVYFLFFCFVFVSLFRRMLYITHSFYVFLSSNLNKISCFEEI